MAMVAAYACNHATAKAVNVRGLTFYLLCKTPHESITLHTYHPV